MRTFRSLGDTVGCASFLGCGTCSSATETGSERDAVWTHLKWDLWLDGRPVNLSLFGTSDRTLHYFPAAGGKNVILREWSVIVIGVTPGRHVIRYRSRTRSLGTTDATWTFTVR